MLPHFGEYVAFKLDPVVSLKALNDPEVTKACEALESKTYVSCVTYVRRLVLATSILANSYHLPAPLISFARC